MGVSPVTESIRQGFDRALQSRVLERGQTPAAIANSVVVMALPGHHRLEARPAVTDLHPLHQSLRREQIEGAVDARDPDSLATRPEPVSDLTGVETAVLGSEQSDDRASRPAGSPGPR